MSTVPQESDPQKPQQQIALGSLRIIARGAHVAIEMFVQTDHAEPQHWLEVAVVHYSDVKLATKFAAVNELIEALTALTNGYRYSTEVCNIARAALATAGAL